MQDFNKTKRRNKYTKAYKLRNHRRQTGGNSKTEVEILGKICKWHYKLTFCKVYDFGKKVIEGLNKIDTFHIIYIYILQLMTFTSSKILESNIQPAR